ncbi:DUF402 domain-containing protein [Cellulomonas xiejunii]|uniref:DUF402 domain-containing protein n=1 Tax=Cellulomonas xiejunii TaxID=2968083 RepID=A0ABY5KMM5_9CELL|nr:DUF402 domain-containing protein [Cellulomonas xiejunii]MCC2321172.1 DUF402 domain-containing protein [Cellulomonas xiejunii]UUI71762.1 DUF402 domain-containing protein [Cellulomonas xiejunii]
MSEHFRPGDDVVVREVVDDLVWTERPVTVVVDEPDQLVLHQAAGSVTREPIDPSERTDYLRIMAGRRWTLRDKVWQPPGRLRIGRVGQPFEVWRISTPDEREVAAWYVNLQEPLRRTADGFETLDHVLDILVAPDLSWWRWKDEDELSSAVEHGVLTARDAAAIRATGEAVIADIERGDPPWDLTWGTWQPGERDWTAPGAPERPEGAAG